MAAGGGEGSGARASPPPIATTPPGSRFGHLLDDLQSQSSTPGTHVSSISGISLGEAIRQTANQGMESWYQLPGEQDVSSFMPTFGEMRTLAEQSEFPTLEEGSLNSELDHGKGLSEVRTHSLNLEIQDSRLSPCLQLLTSASTQVQTFFDDTPYQQTAMDFAPLSGSLDMSELPEHPSKSLQISEAVVLAGTEVLLDFVSGSFTLSQHRLATGIEGAGDASSMYYLSQHPLLLSQIDRGDIIDQSSWTITEHFNPDADAPKLRDLPSLVSEERVQSPLEEVHKVLIEDGSFLDSSVPAPLLLKLLEKEIGISSSSDMSSRSSSCPTFSSKEEENNIPQDPEQRRHNISEHLVLNENKFETTKSDPYQLEEESFKDSTEIDFFNTESFKDFESENVDPNNSCQSNRSGITVRPVNRQSSEVSKEEIHKQLCSEIQLRYQERDLSKTSEGRTASSTVLQTSVVVTESAETYSEKENTVVEVHSDVGRDEVTMSSRCSIERGHKDTGISPADNPPVEDASFFGRLAHPISQSTPGTFAVKKQLAGKLMQIKAKLTESAMSLNEEPSNNSSVNNLTPCRKPQSLQSSHEGYPESTDSQKSPPPHGRRIQSLPSLNYIEKVGAWNTNQSFDALVLRGLTGVSPKKRAYNAVADSLNRMLAKQDNSGMPKRGLAASFAGTSSMTSLSSKGKKTCSALQLTRSQSYNSVSTVGTQNSPDTENSPADQKLEAVVKSLREGDDTAIKSDAVQNRDGLAEARAKQAGVSLDTNVIASDADLEHKAKDQSLQEKALSAVERSIESDERVVQRRDGKDKSNDKSVPNLDIRSSNLTMDRFSDISVDTDLNFFSSSHSSDHINQTFTSSAGAVSMHSLTSLEVDNFVPHWSPSSKTSDRKEINIEERIPTYLRNLGINQSPTTILTPFVPKGPIREPEFSPSELRTLKGSTATPTTSMQLSEGSQSAVNISQASVSSTASTMSMSIPMGSEPGNDSPFPTERTPPCTSRSTHERPISQDDTTSYHFERGQQLLSFQTCECKAEEGAEMLANEQQRKEISIAQSLPLVLQSEDDPTVVSKRVKQLINTFEKGATGLNRDNQCAGIFEVGQLDLTSIPSASNQKQALDSINDSFVGSKTLKEIRELLAEADNAGLFEPCGNPLTAPLKDSYELSPSMWLKLDDSLKSEDLNIRTASPGDLFARTVSWDASLDSNITNDNLLIKSSLINAGLDWDNSLAVSDPIKGDSYLEEVVEGKKHLTPPDPTAFDGLQRHFWRSEPEGSSGAVTDKMMGNNVQLQNRNNSKDSAGVSAVEAGRTAELLNSVACAVGGLEQALVVTGVGYLRGREEVPESDESSADSLAARVASLLKSGASGTQVIRGVEDEEKRARGSAKLKLASQPSFTETDLNQEDRKRIEEIKRELLKGAKQARLSKAPCHTAYDLQDLSQWKDVEHFRSRFTQSPILGQSHDLRPLELRKRSTEQLGPQADDGEYKNQMNSEAVAAYTDASSMTRLSTGSHLSPDFHQPSIMYGSHSTECQKGNGISNEVHKKMPFSPPKSSEEATKPITSITFASRKRSPPVSIDSNSEVASPEQTPFNIRSTSWDPMSINTFLGVQPAPLISKPNNESHVHQDLPISKYRDVILDQSPKHSSAEQTQADHFQSSSENVLPFRSHFIDQSSALDRGSVSVTKCNSPDVRCSPSTSRSSERISVGHQWDMDCLRHETLKVESSEMTPLDQGLDKANIGGPTSNPMQINIGKRHGDGAYQSSPANFTTAGSTTASSPTRKALSCIHVTISPKQDHLKKIDTVFNKSNVAGTYDSADETPDGKLDMDAAEISRSSAAKLSRNEQALLRQDVSIETAALSRPSSYFLHSPAAGGKSITKAHSEDIGRPMSHSNKENMPESATDVVQKHKPLSDAITQITTESPGKTIFSAEIFINGRETEDKISGSSKGNETPELQLSPGTQMSDLSRATDQPLLLPYRPPGSHDLFYVPYREGVSRISPVRSDSTIESSHPGSNDAVSPNFSAEMLGSASQNALNTVPLKHKEGIYSKGAAPRAAWEQGAAQAKKPATGCKDYLESPTKPKPVSRPAVQHLPQKEPENQFGPYTTLRQGGSRSEDESRDRSTNVRDKLQLPSYHPREEKEFLPLKPVVDYSREYYPDVKLAPRYKAQEEELEPTQTKKNASYTLGSSQTTDVTGRSAKSEQSLKNGKHTLNSDQVTDFSRSQRCEQPLRNANNMVTSRQATDASGRMQEKELTHTQTTLSNHSLDDLWARFTERKKNQLSESSSKLEMSLVERLDRLARILQNPVAHSLLATADEWTDQDKIQRRKENGRQWESNKVERERLSQKTFIATTQQVKGESTLDEMKISSYHIRRKLQQGQYVDKPSDRSVDSDFSRDVGSTEIDGGTTETETATQTDSDTMTQTGVSSSISTIDTVRLIKAFGPERVRPSSTLSHLYNTIDLQKKHTKDNMRKGSRNCASGERSRTEFVELQKSRNKVQMSESDTVSTSSSSWEPSPALINKRSIKVLNKGIQAGDLEIVNSATKKKTRDVGTTFPSPRREQQRSSTEPPTRGHVHGEENTWAKRVLTEKRGRRSKPHLPQGLSWFVPAEDLIYDSRKENKTNFWTGPGPAWNEPLTNTKPWREPLQERNQQEQPIRRGDGQLTRSYPIKDGENKSPRPFVKITLQESLKTHRPDFIFRSGERVKRLQLVAKERKLQSVFQTEREELFNQPGMRFGSNYPHSNKDARIILRNRTIPKTEMVQRSKSFSWHPIVNKSIFMRSDRMRVVREGCKTRIYEQLPEVKKRRADEKKKSEYESYRLKAQLFRKKVTNHILGRKTPWN
ncbi:centrosome-associated protein ALMS1 isoform X2 [Ascaphus truei]|uniref:centrosome-associated protein ALMS1 isoform X2 n=1 Tax=Ascaphus truei TaxID=8439 RepID=UPI003F5A0AE8